MRKPDAGFSAAALAAVLFDELRLPPGAHFKVAYSGGLDSHVLLHALSVLRADHHFSLSAIHIDHDLQPASAEWGRHCAGICTSLDVQYVVERVKVTGVAAEGLEAAARRARYAALAAALEPGDTLLTAHHCDDQEETVFLQLLRGAGVAGLAAMPAKTALGHGQIVRPLLGFSRTALHTYAQEHRLAWIEDPSNRTLHLRRNFLRTEILPRLARHWPAHASMLARTAHHAAEAMGLLDEVAETDLATCRQAVAHSPQALSINALLALSMPRQRNLLRYWLRRQGYLAPATSQLEEVLAQVQTTPRSQQARVCWPGTEVWRYRDLLVALPAQHAPDPALDVVWDLCAPLDLPDIGRLCAVPLRGQGLSCARLNGKSLHVRLRSGGETLMLAGRSHHHVLKKLLQAEGVPPWLRARLPLFYVDHELVAVADRWVCAPYLARDGEEGLKIVWEPPVGTVGAPEKAR
ncbi:MAG TPA: tRNA lysidine(34) synthetase TilS [Acidiferrobacterales bacterium]|nr:tRNA lysidine(34) synthetase TilS [Acidiferrobacterales bacterium]